MTPAPSSPGWVEREASEGRLPARYATTPWTNFFERCGEALRPGARILDVGGGKEPTIPKGRRPPRCLYMGMDVSADELRVAPPGSYTGIIEADICDLRPGLVGSFDLVVSWQTLEHVFSMDRALKNIRTYLVDGGLFVAYFAGRYAFAAVVNRALPEPVSRRVAARLRLANQEDVFPALYNDCYPEALERHLEAWASSDIVPLYRAAGYFYRLGWLRTVYVAYESWAARKHTALASHFLVAARR